MKLLKLLAIVAGCALGSTTQAQNSPIRLEPVPELGAESGKVRANLASEKAGTTVPTDTSPAVPMAPNPKKAVSGNAAARLELPLGNSAVPLVLADLYDINRIFFRSISARGSIRVLSSNRPLAVDSPDWEEIVPPVEFGGKEVVDEDFADLTAQYLIFEFNLTAPGQISPLGVMGEEFITQASAHPPTAEELDAIPESEKASLVPYDFASLVNGSAVTRISSGPLVGANLMIDDDITTFYEFDVDDPDAMLLLDLRAHYRVNRIGFTLEAQPGKLDVYAFNILPESLRPSGEGEAGNGGTEAVIVDSTFFDTVFPVASRTFDDEADVAELDFDDTDARYALISWRVAPGSEGTSLPLRIHEISFIGMVPDTMASFRLVPQAQFAGVEQPEGVPIPEPEPIPIEIPDPVSPR